ncbi:MAG: helix-turn-helix transcriptional regulator [Planctomycetes bacterium]|nr:helix-turn-helix transcriptional regulator [Planctomycetota bacterium]
MIASRQTPAKPHAPMDAERIAEFAALFKLLSDGNRLRIVLRISGQGEQNVTDLCQFVGLPQPLVSHHLARLREAGVLATRRSGKHVFYSVRRDRFRQLMAELAGRDERSFTCDRFLECVFG